MVGRICWEDNSVGEEHRGHLIHNRENSLQNKSNNEQSGREKNGRKW